MQLNAIIIFKYYTWFNSLFVTWWRIPIGIDDPTDHWWIQISSVFTAQNNNLVLLMWRVIRPIITALSHIPRSFYIQIVWSCPGSFNIQIVMNLSRSRSCWWSRYRWCTSLRDLIRCFAWAETRFQKGKHSFTKHDAHNCWINNKYCQRYTQW